MMKIIVIVIAGLCLIAGYWQFIYQEKPNDGIEFDESLEFDFTLTDNTNIVYPANNSEITGWIRIITYVITCNCTGYTRLYVDDIFISNGTHDPDEPMKYINDKWYEVFHNDLDTNEFSNGQYQITMIGKHDQYSDQITVSIKN